MTGLSNRYPGKKLFIGEIGWPRYGRARSCLAPSPVEQARIIRGVANVCSKLGWSYNVVEAFDHPWKHLGEDSAGGAWGVISEDGELISPLVGKTFIEPIDIPCLMLSPCISFALIGLVFTKLRMSTECSAFMVCFLSMIFGYVLYIQAKFAVSVVYSYSYAVILAAMFFSSFYLSYLCINQTITRIPVAIIPASDLFRFNFYNLQFDDMHKWWASVAVFVLRLSAVIETLVQAVYPVSSLDFATVNYLILALSFFPFVGVVRNYSTGAFEFMIGFGLLFGGTLSLALEECLTRQLIAHVGITFIVACQIFFKSTKLNHPRQSRGFIM